MSLGPKEKEIGGHQWKLGLLGTSDALDFMARLAKLAGPAMTERLVGGESGAIEAIGALFRTLDAKELAALVRKLLGSCLMDDKPLFGPNGTGGIYEMAFQGNLGLLFQVVAWALQENLGDFSGLLAMLRERVAAVTAMRAARGELGLGGGLTSNTTGPSSA